MPSVIRYEKQVPGHHVQVDVKFLDLIDPGGAKVRRFQVRFKGSSQHRVPERSIVDLRALRPAFSSLESCEVGC